MYAVVEIAGQQFIVQKGDQILAPMLSTDQNESIKFDRVLLTADDEDVQIGTPLVETAVVKATKLNDERGEKVIVFKKKRRKGYKVTKGHRQDYTRLQIDDIVFEGGTGNGS
jgi:large subunit ribosomal protein L21